MDSSKEQAFPVQLRVDPSCGRFVVSTKDIQAGDVIFRAAPYAIAIKHVRHTCAFCLKSFLPNEPAFLDDEGSFDTATELRSHCADCSEAWYCSEEERLLDHARHRLECHLLKRISSFSQLSLYMKTELKVAVRVVINHQLDLEERKIRASTSVNLNQIRAPTFADVVGLCDNR